MTPKPPTTLRYAPGSYVDIIRGLIVRLQLPDHNQNISLLKAALKFLDEIIDMDPAFEVFSRLAELIQRPIVDLSVDGAIAFIKSGGCKSAAELMKKHFPNENPPALIPPSALRYSHAHPSRTVTSRLK